MTGLLLFSVAVAIFSSAVFFATLNKIMGLIDSVEDSIESIEKKQKENRR